MDRQTTDGKDRNPFAPTLPLSEDLLYRTSEDKVAVVRIGRIWNWKRLQ